jgi:hypothetical protein
VATYTHGIKDGVDEMLEKAQAIDRLLEAKIKPDTSDEKLESIRLARARATVVKESLTNLRDAVEAERKTK